MRTIKDRGLVADTLDVVHPKSIRYWAEPRLHCSFSRRVSKRPKQFLETLLSKEWSISCAKKTVFQQTCTLQEHFGHCVHHHRQEGHWQRCALRKVQTRPPTWPLKWILSTKTHLFPTIDSSPGLSRDVLSGELLLPETLVSVPDDPALMIMWANVGVSSLIPILVKC